MANCPKCGYHLKLTDWRPNCPSCGINLVYYGMEERLLADADKAESEHAVFQKKIDRVKASFVGSKLAIARIVVTVLPILALFLPWAKMNFKAPFIDQHSTVNIIKIGTRLSTMDFGALLELAGSKLVGNIFTMFMGALVAILLAAVFALLGLILLFLSCSPKGIARNITLSSFGLVLTLAATLMFTRFNSLASLAFPGAYSGSLSFGVFILMLMFIAVIAINIVIAKTGGIKVKYKQTYVSGIPSEEDFAAKEAGIDVLSLQLNVSDEEARIAIEKALIEAGIRKASESESESESGPESEPKAEE